MQALCCLNPTLVIGPGDQSPGEFRVRPYPDTAKDTGAQHRQAVRPTPPPRPQEASILGPPPTPQYKGGNKKTANPKAGGFWHARDWLRSVSAVVRRFLGDLHIMHVGLTYTRSRNFHELSLGVQF